MSIFCRFLKHILFKLLTIKNQAAQKCFDCAFMWILYQIKISRVKHKTTIFLHVYGIIWLKIAFSYNLTAV